MVKKARPILYLASASPRRKEILGRMRIPFRVVISDYVERDARKVSPGTLTVQHAVGKVKQARKAASMRFILGADTIVYCRGRVLGKPQDFREASGMLRLLSGRQHSVFTGVALLDRKTGKIWKACCETKVWIRPLTDGEIEKYVVKVNSLDKAGGYAVQLRPKIVTRIEGSHSNVIGLPREIVRKFWREATSGIRKSGN